MHNGSFIEDHGKYSVVVNELSKYRFSKTEFDSLWEHLIREFTAYDQTKESKRQIR